MTAKKAVEKLQELRDKGYLVIIKAMPPEFTFLMEGSRSEYDAPVPDRKVGKGKIFIELENMRGPTVKILSGFADTFTEAVEKLCDAIQIERAKERK